MTDDPFAPLRPMVPITASGAQLETNTANFGTIRKWPPNYRADCLLTAAIAHCINSYPERESLIVDLAVALRPLERLHVWGLASESRGRLAQLLPAALKGAAEALASAAALGLADRKEGGT